MNETEIEVKKIIDDLDRRATLQEEQRETYSDELSPFEEWCEQFLSNQEGMRK